MTLFLTRQEKQSLRRIVAMLDVDRRGFILSVILGSLGLGSAIALGATSAWLIARASQMPPVMYLTVAATGVRLFGVSRAVLRYLQRLASHRVALRGMDSLRQNLYAAIASRRVDRVATLRRGDLLARTGQDVDDVGDLVVKTLLPAWMSAIVGIGVVGGITLISVPAGLILAGCLVVAGIVAPLLSMRSARVAQQALTHARSELSATTMAIMDGATELQVSGMMPSMRQSVESTEDALTAATARSSKIAGIAAGVDRLAMGMAVVGALLVGIPPTTSGALAAVLLAVLVLTPLSSFEGTAELGPAAAQLVRSAAAAQRIDELLGDEDLMVTHAVPESSEGSVIIADNLAIGWPSGPTIAEDIHMRITPGSRIALVGPSGIGKTTLAMTLAGLIPPKSGTVTINGVDAWGASRADVSSHVTVTAEDAHIFAASVYENLRVARADLSRDEARNLVVQAGLGPWLEALPDGLDTSVGSGGTTVSGGERRRLLMARAMAAPAPLMLVDEAGEHLDGPTADALVTTLLSGDDDHGVLVITHRLSALDSADEVVVLDRPQGSVARIVDRGSHRDIISRSSGYEWAVQQEDL
ncbi:thiol reductant ABC exporter subunit CydC [Schaalia vaccimaxillae]|uniref:thiol reductant ABC exporter subunit CydC n=1 Tax=Schaalia vaccimaxillae TaxID=183916 RepID=UPI0003B515FC|nr:thiol reductant ABC exporter subunit CydC [Schaalia vaccimaxillae]